MLISKAAVARLLPVKPIVMGLNLWQNAEGTKNKIAIENEIMNPYRFMVHLHYLQ
jgi:hypothetical protein